MNKIYFQTQLGSCFDNVENVQFARANEKTQTLLWQEQVSDHLSPEPHRVTYMRGRKESDADSSAEGLIEAAQGQRIWVTSTQTLCDCWCPKHRPDPDGSRASKIPGQTCSLCNMAAQWGAELMHEVTKGQWLEPYWQSKRGPTVKICFVVFVLIN